MNEQAQELSQKLRDLHLQREQIDKEITVTRQQLAVALCPWGIGQYLEDKRTGMRGVVTHISSDWHEGFIVKMTLLSQVDGCTPTKNTEKISQYSAEHWEVIERPLSKAEMEAARLAAWNAGMGRK